ncbi:MAG: Gfo/Idh/MocA family oxidoreductase [Gammaproteobacteria bacterium]|nr:Gfo/Idh/MocA family oxidoreductase [Gammaproteobacteria bacterium]
MVGGGSGAFIGNVHRMAARLDDEYELVAGALSSEPNRALLSGKELRLDNDRIYSSYEQMAASEARRSDGVDVVSIVTPNYLHYDAARTFLQASVHVICDKPITVSLEQAISLVQEVKESGRVFAVTYNYSGYPMVRQAREMIAAGEIGEIRVVQIEYPQAWLTHDLANTGNKQAGWRSDPDKAGPGGCLGDIGTHAYHLLHFVTGLDVSEVAVDLTSFVSGRKLDDNVHSLLRFANGARGMLWASQVAPGHDNGLRLRVYGSKGSIAWFQESPNTLSVSDDGGPIQLLSRGAEGLTEAAVQATRIPSGHPEGFLEAFAQLYRDIAELIRAKEENRQPDSSAQLAPTVIDGVNGMRFIEAALESSQANSAWVKLEP